MIHTFCGKPGISSFVRNPVIHPFTSNPVILFSAGNPVIVYSLECESFTLSKYHTNTAPIDTLEQTVILIQLHTDRGFRQMLRITKKPPPKQAGGGGALLTPTPALIYFSILIFDTITLTFLYNLNEYQLKGFFVKCFFFQCIK